MIQNIDNRRFISFEGIDFCGKSTQLKILMKKLADKEIVPELIREPGGTNISEKIRAVVLDPANPEMCDRCEILLYEAARAQLVDQKIIPLLNEGKYLIADRFFDSTTAYQGAGRGLDFAMVQKLNLFATSALKPYKTFFLDISPETARQRQKENQHGLDRLESGGSAFFKKVRDGYLQLCENDPERFIKISGEDTIENLAEIIWTKVCELWQL